MKSDVSSNLLQTNSDFVFRFWMPFFHCHSSENTFLYVGNKIVLLWVLYHKKKHFCFFVAKTRCTQLYSTKNMFGLFAVILGCFQSYCTKKRSSSSMQRVTLIFTWFYSNNGFAFFWLSYAVSESSFWVQPCSLFPKPNYTWTLYITGKMFWLVGKLIRLLWALRAFLPFCVQNMPCLALLQEKHISFCLL